MTYQMKRKTVDGVVLFGVWNHRKQCWAVEPTLTSYSEAAYRASTLQAIGA
jgi:hypothetical protein